MCFHSMYTSIHKPQTVKAAPFLDIWGRLCNSGWSYIEL
jgi:hypothetical protein